MNYLLELFIKGTLSFNYITKLQKGVLKLTSSKTPDEKQLWTNWQKYRNDAAANILIEKYMYLVSFHVERISGNLPNNVNREDLKSLGLLGLFDAMKKFDPERNLKFDTYASFRIRGTIIDGLRKEDWLPRSLRDKTKNVEQAAQRLEQSLQRTPSAYEIAEETGLEAPEVESFVKDSLISNVWSLEEKVEESNHGQIQYASSTVDDNSTNDPDVKLVKKELKKELIESLKILNKNEQFVISLFYEEELTFTEIGKILNLTTSRISQIHKKAIFKLRSSLKKIQANA